MGELGGAQKYLYWANRRVRQWLDDSNVKISDVSRRTLRTPHYGNVVPTVEVAHERRATKTELASLFQRSFGQRIVSDLAAPGPIEFARGEGTVAFGEFVSPAGSPLRALLHVAVPIMSDNDDTSVAVCLFGSLENYADFVVEAGAQRGYGWTASSANDIEHFLKGGACEGMDICESLEAVARTAVQVCCRQGERSAGRSKGYHRDFTYGQTKEVAEWCAEIYMDIDLSSDPEHGYSRVLVGAPLWVRTPNLRSITLYSEYTREELEAADSEGASIDQHRFSDRLKRAFRALRGSEL